MLRRRFLFLLTLLSNLAVSPLYAEAMEIPSTPDNSNTAPVLAENNAPTAVPTAVLEQQAQPEITQPAETKPHHGAVTAELSLKQQGQRLYAYVVVEQLKNASGKIRIDWTPPAHSSCDKSSYILSYEGTQFHTQAYRTLGYGLINGKSVSCTGTWQADVKNARGVTLATATIQIEAVDAYAKANTNPKANAKMMRSLAAIA